MSRTRSLAILLFDDVEVLDFCGPFEVFSVASRQTDPPDFDVFTVAEKPGPVAARNGLSVNPRYTLADCPTPHMLLVPGGLGTRTEMGSAPLIDWIKRTADAAELILSVCTGALLLGKAGLLDGQEATTHHVGFDLLREIAPTATVHEDRRIQSFETTGLSAIFDSVSHFKGHTQEIICLTRMQLGDRYQFDWIPSTPEQGAP